MKSEAEDPTGHLPRLFPLAVELCKLDEDDMLSSGRFVVLPLDFWSEDNLPGLNQFAGWMEYVIGYTKAAVVREAFKVGPDRESPGVPSAHVIESSRHQIHGREMGQCAEAAQSRYCCELL